VMLSTEIFEVSKFILPLDPAEHKWRRDASSSLPTIL
jgi:hypothetical protein